MIVLILLYYQILIGVAMRERITEVDVHYPPIKAKPERSERIGGGSAAWFERDGGRNSSGPARRYALCSPPRLCCVRRGRAHSEQAAPAPLPASRSPTPASLRCACWVRTPRAALSPADHASAAEKLARNGSRSPLAALRASRRSRSRICFLAWRRGLVTGWLQVVGLLGWAGGGVTMGRLYWLGWV